MTALAAVVLAAVVALVAGSVPAAASGGWAVTYLDPPPSRFESGKSYAVGFWVLQHGTHPFEGELGDVGLRLTREDGESVLFDGTALPEAGHYATSVVVPEGEWKVAGVQGIFAPYPVGTLTVPGVLKINPIEPDLLHYISADAEDHWGAVHPPGFPVGGEGTLAPDSPADEAVATAPAPVAATAGAPAAPNAARGSGQDSGGVPAYTLAIAAVGGALLAATGLSLARRRRVEEEQETDPGADTIAIPG
ncbi:hypothetical protein ITP53_19315 [Nonomuraea sp. K274]|uniref:LPXTG-motif cell wall-anchored protein n=1 Tax=Nonomuraea cypriaca TaxID=1187855 RepID=A0A931AA78_9ACTN|nr:hypothetical protein [Nonomuraea cypriaca]MBF8187845.1 hypothetical protein [Nonomuraea cypriaca]